MSTSNLYSLTKQDITKGAECLKDAFRDDPIWSEVFKNTTNKEEALLAFFTCPLLHGLKYGNTSSTTSGLDAIAVWVPGKYASMTVWQMIRNGSFKYGAKMGREASPSLSSMSKQITRDRKEHMKGKEYLYLTIIGVASHAQGKGHGSVLLEAIKAECDQNNLYLYLETETEKNVEFYKKHGFSILKKISLDTLNLPMWEMVYEPKGF